MSHSLLNLVFIYNNNIATLDFKRAKFDFFQYLLGRIPCVIATEGREVQDSWLIFKHHFLQFQDQCLSKSKKKSKENRRLAWMSKDLLSKHKQNMEYTDCKKRDKPFGRIIRKLE